MSPPTSVFSALRSIMLAAGAGRPVASDEPGNLILHSGVTDPKSGKQEWFGAVTAKKSYVSYHLIPLYNDPALGAGLSDDLARRRQGKSCFNFKTVDDSLFVELADLTRRANDAFPVAADHTTGDV